VKGERDRKKVRQGGEKEGKQSKRQNRKHGEE
jgi:hypothetical protein